MSWCAEHRLDPLSDIRGAHVELYARELESRGLAAATVALNLGVLTGFYRYCVGEQLLEHSPAVHVRRPKVPQESTRIGLDRNELGAFLVQAERPAGTTTCWPCLLGLNALRLSEPGGAELAEHAAWCIVGQDRPGARDEGGSGTSALDRQRSTPDNRDTDEREP